MAERKYSVAEIDRMRCAVQSIYWIDTSTCEDRLRTFMLNGTEPEELVSLAKAETARRNLTYVDQYGSAVFLPDFRPGAINRVG